MPTLLNRPIGRKYGPTQPVQVQRHTPDPTLEPIPDWAKLSRDDDMSLYLDGRELSGGRVDMRALDGSVLWIIQHDGGDRAMFLHSDGLLVFRRSAKNSKLDRVYYTA